MKISILGAGGNIGQRITREAALRKHDLHLITSKPISFFKLENTPTTVVDIFDTEALANALKDSDLIISAYAPPLDNPAKLSTASESILGAVKKNAQRLIVVGGAGSLLIGKNELLVDSPNFPEAYKGVALAHKDALYNIYRKSEGVNWTNVSPAAYIFEGEKTGQFRIGKDNLIANEKGESSISMEDFAVAILDEVDNKQFSNQRFTVGY
ncbi:NAD(P)-dependent oxidoreductase [Flavobacterium sp. 14A]|uniref:NAD(P)-dependent oxidoreductase n=1 Tax=Flavobacterium sp. 14A TaxID=2735896 RepID=UPI00156EB85A|nr:NAD(P)H-binding protein [Flavobacterium sp. 14A]NRT11636.1 hypothetical protein [Flavobacterium sp. 14A]